jgi:hypothetical protein
LFVTIKCTRVTGDDGGHRDEISLMLAAAGRTADSLPVDLQTAFAYGQLSPTTVKRFLALDSNWFTKLFMPFQGMLVHFESNRFLPLT